MVTTAQTSSLCEFAHLGFTLEHDGDTVLFLFHEGELVTRFSQTGATEKSLQGECAKHLVIGHGWDGCIWSRKEDDR
jgi:hypothetical protein